MTHAFATCEFSGKFTVRIIAILVAASCATVLLLAARVAPDPRGLGSHAALGLPPCSLPAATGYPCPTCGITTSAVLFAKLHPIASFQAQPAGFILAGALALGGLIAFLVSLSGRVPNVLRRRWSFPGVTFALLWVIVLGWLYKLALGVAMGIYPLRP